MLTLAWEIVIITLFVIVMIALLAAGVLEIFFGIIERDIAQIAVGVMLGLVFLMIVLGPFVDTKNVLSAMNPIHWNINTARKTAQNWRNSYCMEYTQTSFSVLTQCILSNSQYPTTG